MRASFRFSYRVAFALTLLCRLSHGAEETFFRRTGLKVQSEPGPLLVLQNNAALGIHFTNNIPAAEYVRRQNLMNGAGVALGDFDGDGLCDVFLCNKFGPSALYRNLGNWHFEDVTARAAVACTNQISVGAVFADINGDGKLDLLVSSFQGPNALFLNLGNGSFTNVTTQFGLNSRGGATSLALADLDGDGELDLYLANFAVEAILRDGIPFSTQLVNGQQQVTGRYAKRLRIVDGRLIESGEPDFIFQNKSGKLSPWNWAEHFKDAKGRSFSSDADFGFAVQLRDLNGDGSPDIYICNDFQTPDRFWINDGAGHFRPIDQLALRNMSYASMGVDFADIDRDGHLDFITVEMLSPDHVRHLREMSPKPPNVRAIGDIETREEVARNCLYHNRGDGTYEEIAWFSGVAASDWSWTPIFLDVDLDGYDDLLISNGHLHDVNDRDISERGRNAARKEKQTMFLSGPRLDTANLVFRNRRDLSFENTSDKWGFNSRQITYGVALADLDNDGDLDVVANCANAAPLFYKNNAAQPRVAVRLVGRKPNFFAIGGKIHLRNGKLLQTQEVLAGARFLSSDDTTRTFAVPGSEPCAIEVIWPNGGRTYVPDAQPNSLYEIFQNSSAAALRKPPMTTPRKRWFADVSSQLGHTHHEEPFDDFERQPLLPHRLSQLGPGIAWIDLDGDSQDELVIGSGRGGKPVAFKRADNWSSIPLSAQPLPDDMLGVIGWPSGQTNAAIFAFSQYEHRAVNEPPVRGAENLGDLNLGGSSAGTIITADVDGDGDLDLFVGGRVVPGHYPQTPISRLFRKENGRLAEAASDRSLFDHVGMVSSAVFSDLDSDGFPELILAIEWGPIRIYKNNNGQLHDATIEYGLDRLTGLWTSITTGDLNGDGQLDIIAGNRGRNSFYNRAGSGPWALYYGDFAENNGAGIIEAYHDPALQKVVPFRDLDTLGAQYPALRARFKTHEAFANASLTDLLGADANRTQSLSAQTLESTIFWNLGGKFRAEALPAPAQFAPVFGMNVADFDNDAFEDLFLAQNFFAMRGEDDRLDGGRSLLLQGNPGGKLTPLDGAVSGLQIYGEQRGSAVGDYDSDGRVDLVVAQNGAPTKLYHNTTVTAGLRVRLKGPPGNPCGIGAILRVKTGSALGPAREIHGGSGYLSQDSVVQILPALPESEIIVLWPGGQRTTHKIPQDFREIQLDRSGGSERIH